MGHGDSFGQTEKSAHGGMANKPTEIFQDPDIRIREKLELSIRSEVR
jgi:hypothetical protein